VLILVLLVACFSGFKMVPAKAGTQVLPNGVYMLRNGYSNKYLDVVGGGTANDTKAHQWELHGNLSQQWKITWQNNGYYRIEPMHAAGKSLDCFGAYSNVGTQIQIFASNSGTAQQWEILSAGNSGGNQRYYISPRCAPGKYGGVPDYNVDNGGSMKTRTSALEAQWYFEPAHIPGMRTTSDYISTSYYLKNIDNNGYLNVGSSGASTTTSRTQSFLLNSGTGASVYMKIASTLNSFITVSGTSLKTTTSGNQFTICRSDSAANQRYYYVKYGTQFVTLENGVVKLTASATTNSRWSVESVAKRDADFFYFKYTGFDSSTHAAGFQTTFNSLGYAAGSYLNRPAATAYSWMEMDGIFVFGHHAGAGVLGFGDQKDVYNGYITTNARNTYYNKPNWPIDNKIQNSLADAKCVLLLGCNTGNNSDGTNLVSSFLNRGAHFALGTTDKIMTGPPLGASDRFLKAFMDKAKTGATIDECVDAGRKLSGYPMNKIFWQGDNKQRLN